MKEHIKGHQVDSGVNTSGSERRRKTTHSNIDAFNEALHNPNGIDVQTLDGLSSVYGRELSRALQTNRVEPVRRVMNEVRFISGNLQAYMREESRKNLDGGLQFPQQQALLYHLGKFDGLLAVGVTEENFGISERNIEIFRNDPEVRDMVEVLEEAAKGNEEDPSYPGISDTQIASDVGIPLSTVRKKITWMNDASMVASSLYGKNGKHSRLITRGQRTLDTMREEDNHSTKLDTQTT